MLTLKLKYKCLDTTYYDILNKYMSQYSICLHYLYNRISDNNSLSEKDLRALCSNINNIEYLDSWFKQSCVKESIVLYKSFQSRCKEHEETREQKLKEIDFKLKIGRLSEHKYSIKKHAILKPLKLIFGGKENYRLKQEGKISKEEFKQNRLSPIYSIGESQFKGNRKFNINSDLTITFKPSKDKHFDFKLIYGQNQEHYLKSLYELSLTNSISISYKLDKDYIYITFDESKLSNTENIKIQNRVLGIDMNPNYIGWSIVDWKSSSEFEIVESGVYSFKKFSDLYKQLNDLKTVSSDDPRRIRLSNKRTYETIKVAENIINKAIYYKCQIVSIEDLNIKAKDKDKGKDYNALCNNHWLRTTFCNQLRKRTNIHKIQLVEIKPEYSSFIGNFLFRSLNLPDMILSSIEISRRGYEYFNQYIIKLKEQKKNIIQPNINDFIKFWKMSMEELRLEFDGSSLIELYNFIKSEKDLPLFKGDPNKVRIQIKTDLVKRFFSNNSFVYI